MDYEIFNLIEALFWITLGLFGFALRNWGERRYRQFAIYASIILVAFGSSDVAEVLYGSFFDPSRLWLLIWKVVNVVAILYGFAWYILLRLRR